MQEQTRHQIRTNRRTVALITLGCKVNQYETDGMAQALEAAGYEIVPEHVGADVTVVNTCAVTNIAQRKSRQQMHRAKKLRPDTILVAAGCYVQNVEDVLAQLPEVDIFLGNNQKHMIASFLEEYEQTRTRASHMLDINHTSEYEEFQLTAMAEHTRAYVKIQDGCNQFCSYCIIPYVRGRVRSRKLADIVTEVRQLAENGYREIVLTGIHISSYGADLVDEPVDLLSLLSALHGVENIARIRLGSLEPTIVTGEFAKAIASLPKICPHFHLSLQSGCDTVLQRMNRKYTTEQYRHSVQLLRRVYDNPAITTDVIVGFPGESDKEFEQTYRYLEELQLYEMHIFKYSVREGTNAAKLSGQISGDVKHLRSERLLELAQRNQRVYEQTIAKKRLSVLLEEEKQLNAQMYYVGHSREYVKVAILASSFAGLPINEIMSVDVGETVVDGYRIGIVPADGMNEKIEMVSDKSERYRN